LFYKDDNPYRAAFAQRIKLGHKINAKHFVKENEFSRYGRIDKKTLQRRILKCAFFMTLGLWFNYAVVHNPLLVGVLFISAGWYVLHQLIKRYQDLNGYKSINWTDVFVKEPYSKTNNYGLSPASLPKIASRFSQIGTLGKWSFYSLGILLFSYIFPLIVPNYHSVEFPESISFYTIKRNSGDEIAYVLHFTDFQTHIKTNTAIGIKRGVVDEFYVARSFLLNKPLYIELQSSKGVILKENRYYVGMNDYQNTSVIFVFIFIFFQIWLVYNVKDKRMQLFRNISFVMLTLLYLWTALKEWW
ncbi:MAG TPA: hypothetical protein VLY87_06665, partial [Flavobacterium sp.]|nr:hypothetical protein [Flavobacterium sp.]